MRLKVLLCCMLGLMAALLLAGCQQQHSAPPSGLNPETIAAPARPAAAQLLLINQGSLPGFYAVCQLDGAPLPYKLKSGEYIERQVLQAGFHKVECAVEALSVQVSFDCEHTFEVYADEPVYLSLTGRTLPGTCLIKRLSLLPEDFHREYSHARESLPQ